MNKNIFGGLIGVFLILILVFFQLSFYRVFDKVEAGDVYVLINDNPFQEVVDTFYVIDVKDGYVKWKSRYSYPGCRLKNTVHLKVARSDGSIEYIYQSGKKNNFLNLISKKIN